MCDEALSASAASTAAAADDCDDDGRCCAVARTCVRNSFAEGARESILIHSFRTALRPKLGHASPVLHTSAVCAAMYAVERPLGAMCFSIYASTTGPRAVVTYITAACVFALRRRQTQAAHSSRCIWGAPETRVNIYVSSAQRTRYVCICIKWSDAAAVVESSV